MLKGVLTLLLLSLLTQREDYGYAIVLRLRAAGLDGLSEGTVYPALSRLEASGLLSASLVRSSSGPARKYYRVTDQGAAYRDRALGDWRSLVVGVARITAAPAQT
jgi:PadR family transcriptional regulator PadR